MRCQCARRAFYLEFPASGSTGTWVCYAHGLAAIKAAKRCGEIGKLTSI
jgi:hypothetical protein